MLCEDNSRAQLKEERLLFLTGKDSAYEKSWIPIRKVASVMIEQIQREEHREYGQREIHRPRRAFWRWRYR